MAFYPKISAFLRAFATALSLSLAPAAMAEDKAAPAGVLIVHSNQRPLPAGIIVDETLRKVVTDALGGQVELFSEFLDAERFGAPGFAEAQADFLHRKYSQRDIRVLVAVAPLALRFLLDHRARILAGVPVVHLTVPNDLLPEKGLPPDVVGAAIDLDPGETFDMARRLHPAAQRLIVVTGAGERGSLWERRIRRAADRMGGAVKIEYLAGLPTAELLERLRALPRQSIVFTPGYFSDGTGVVVTPQKSVEQIAAASTAPVYVSISTHVGTGAVGGYVAPYEAQAQRAGATVVQLLNGATPAAIPSLPMQNVPLVDARQMHRFGIGEHLLPPDAQVRFRQPTVWDNYWREIFIAIVVVLLQGLLIARLLLERRQRQQAAVALEASEQRANLAARAAGLSAWIWETDGGRIRTSALPGSPDDLLDGVHPLDRLGVRRAVVEALAKDTELNIEYRVQRPGGEVRWISARGRAQKSGGGHLIGVSLDITERKRTELQGAQDRANLRRLTRVSMLGQLSAAIAHQLNQPLAAILGNAEAAQKMLGRERVDLAELRAICDDIVAEDHRAAEVIRRLRDLYRRGEIRREPCDLNVLARETVELLRTELLTRHVVPVIEPAPSLPSINGDRVQLQQVLLNLILNAADAMQKAAEEDRVVTIRTEHAGGRILLSIVDRGTGVPVADAASVFEDFWSTKTDGMGVGLAISKSIVEAHGGSLTVSNNPVAGATFSASLPVAGAA